MNELEMSQAQTEVLDQTALAVSLSELIQYNPTKDILVKPMPVIKIKKTITVPIVVNTDEDGVNEYDGTEEKEIEVDSSFREGIVLKVPTNTTEMYTVGQRVIFNQKFAIDFDLLKDSMLVKPYDIVATVK